MLKTRRKKKTRVVTPEDDKALRDLLKSHARTYFTDWVNPECLKCGDTTTKMIRLQALFFCPSCFLEEFDYKAKTPDKTTYTMWKKKFEKQLKTRGLMPYVI